MATLVYLISTECHLFALLSHGTRYTPAMLIDEIPHNVHSARNYFQFSVHPGPFSLLCPTLWPFAVSIVTAQPDLDLLSPCLPSAQQSMHVWRWGCHKFDIPSFSGFCSFYMPAQPACFISGFQPSFQLAYLYYTAKTNHSLQFMVPSKRQFQAGASRAKKQKTELSA